MNSLHVPDPLVYMARLCKSRASKGGDDNYHIFLNSVQGIARIIRLAGLNPEECRVVCSQSEDSKERNQAILGEFIIQTNNDPVRLFNFYTSTSFQGQDIYDKNGRTFIVSEPHKDHTKMDVLTTIPQICGRIRDSDYKNEITQIWSRSDYKDVSLEEFKATLRQKIEDAEHDAECLNNMTEGGKIFLKEYINKAPYIGIVDDKIIVDRNMANYEIVNYGIVNGQFASKCNMNTALTEAGFKVAEEMIPMGQDIQLENMITIEKTPFKEIFEEYVEIRAGAMFNPDCFRRSRIEVEKPLVKEAYEVLGADKVREMNYNQKGIKRELVKRMDETLDIKAFYLLDGQLPKQVAIPKTEIKTIIQNVYNELGIKQKAKATDLRK